MSNNNKLSRFDELIRKSGKTAIAFSGGVDSSFLLHRASNIGGDKIVAVTVNTPYMSSRETEDAVEFTKQHEILHKIINIPIPANIRYNPADRCYLCKKTIFGHITKYANENGFSSVFDGTNGDDILEIRPGIKALHELNIISPLAEAGMTKKDIRKYAKKVNLSIWSKPAMSCLMTRIPHDTEITEKILEMITKSEAVLFDSGYPGSRVRIHGDVARVECIQGYMKKLISDPDREKIVYKIKEAGFAFVSLDMEGYRSGSMDIPFNKFNNNDK